MKFRFSAHWALNLYWWRHRLSCSRWWRRIVLSTRFPRHLTTKNLNVAVWLSESVVKWPRTNINICTSCILSLKVTWITNNSPPPIYHKFKWCRSSTNVRTKHTNLRVIKLCRKVCLPSISCLNTFTSDWNIDLWPFDI